MPRYLTLEQLRAHVRRQISGSTQAAYAKCCGISSAYLSDVLQGRREPGSKMLAALGFERVVTYKRSGYGSDAY